MRKLFTSPQRAVAAAGLLLLGAQAAQGQTAYGLLSTSTSAPSLVTFNAMTPGTFTATVPVTALVAGQTLVGLDSRPNTGELFALGYNPTSTQMQLYRLNATTAVLTPVGGILTLDLGSNPGRVGFDFNPTVDRIRVTGSNGINARLNPNNGALAATDINLAYAPSDPNAGGRTPGVAGVAYTNSFIGATATTLYDVEAANARLTTQNPPNNGVLNTVGPLNITNLGPADIDIFFDSASGTNQAYLVAMPAVAPGFPSTTLYQVNLTTGAATAVGQWSRWVRR